MKRWLAYAVAVGLAGTGLWLSVGLGMPQLLLFGAGLVGLVGISAEAFVEQSHGPELGDHSQAFSLWASPGLVVVAGLWLVRLAPADSLLPAAVGVAALLGILLLALSAGLRPERRFNRAARFVTNLITYLVVFLLFTLIYHTKERSLVTATSMGLVALAAALEILRPSQPGQASGIRLPALAALIVAETTWALNYWPVGGLIGGALLLLTFYVFSGLLLAVQEGGVDRRVVVEYGTVGIVGLLAVAWTMS